MCPCQVDNASSSGNRELQYYPPVINSLPYKKDTMSVRLKINNSPSESYFFLPKKKAIVKFFYLKAECNKSRGKVGKATKQI